MRFPLLMVWEILSDFLLDAGGKGALQILI